MEDVGPHVRLYRSCALATVTMVFSTTALALFGVSSALSAYDDVANTAHVVRGLEELKGLYGLLEGDPIGK